MKTRASISIKILLLSFLNVVLLGVVFVVFVRVQYRADLSSVLLSPGRDRILAISRLVALELPQTDRAGWDRLLAQSAAANHGVCYLLVNDGTQLAGPPVSLPSSALDPIRSDHPPHFETEGSHGPKPSRFETRLSVQRRDELGQLSQAIKDMAERLSGYVHGQRRFLGDIAHELCSPISRIQAGLGVLEQRAADNQKEYVLGVQEEVEQMSELINADLPFRSAAFGRCWQSTPRNAKNHRPKKQVCATTS